jgi:hypothetical protein
LQKKICFFVKLSLNIIHILAKKATKKRYLGVLSKTLPLVEGKRWKSIRRTVDAEAFDFFALCNFHLSNSGLVNPALS